MALADRYPDKVLFQILRHDQTRLQSYGVSHSLHCAAVCCLTGKRMGWDDNQRRMLVSAAMSMNLSMIELQGRLAVQSAPPTPEQRAAINDHPIRSAEMLAAAGVGRQAVARRRRTAPRADRRHRLSERAAPTSPRLAQALHYVDVFTAKISARSSRLALTPNVAAREIFTGSAGHPLAAALIKEFGIYPPGCFVRLASGEIAIVVQRGQSVNTPVVACLTNVAGQPMMKPLRRETTDKASAIVALVADADVMVRVPWETLYPDD